MEGTVARRFHVVVFPFIGRHFIPGLASTTAVTQPVVFRGSIDAFLADLLCYGVVDHVMLAFIRARLEIEEDKFLPGFLGKNCTDVTQVIIAFSHCFGARETNPAVAHVRFSPLPSFMARSALCILQALGFHVLLEANAIV